MKPDYDALSKCLCEHPDYVFECDVRDKLKLIDFTAMTDNELDEWRTWLSSKGYEVVEYVDKGSRLLDSVWVNEKHQEAIERLRSIDRTFLKLRNWPRSNISKQRVNKLAGECLQIILTLHSMVPAREAA